MPIPASFQVDEPPSLQAGVRPLVILGAARSGTKFLRDLLASSSACAAVPHGLNFVWRRGAHAPLHDAVPPAAYSAEAHQHIRTTLLHLSGIERDASIRFLVERTCANTLRLPAVHAVLPDARYIHIVRDGRDVAASAYEQWTQTPSLLHRLRKLISAPGAGWRYVKHQLTTRSFRSQTSTGWGPHYPGMADDLQKHSIAEVCALQWKVCVETCRRDLASLVPAERYHTVHYENLVRETDAVRRLCRFANLPDPSSVLDRYHQTVRADSIGRWTRTFDAPTARRVQSLLASTLHHLGYSV